MRSLAGWGLVSLLLAGGHAIGAQYQTRGSNAAERARQVVVLIQTDRGHGSGIFIAESDRVCFVVTAKHVVEGASGIVVSRRQGGPIPMGSVSVERTDPKLDLAVLRAFKHQESDRCLRGDDAAVLAPSVFVGLAVRAIGHPERSRWLVPIQAGVVTDVGRDELRFQSDVREGHSGGGLFDSDYGLVGMVIEDSQQEGVAIPIARVLEAVKDLKIATQLVQREPPVEQTARIEVRGADSPTRWKALGAAMGLNPAEQDLLAQPGEQRPAVFFVAQVLPALPEGSSVDPTNQEIATTSMIELGVFDRLAVAGQRPPVRLFLGQSRGSIEALGSLRKMIVEFNNSRVTVIMVARWDDALPAVEIEGRLVIQSTEDGEPSIVDIGEFRAPKCVVLLCQT